MKSPSRGADCTAGARRSRRPWPVTASLECWCSSPISERPAITNRQAVDIAKVRNEVLIEAPNHKRRRRLSVHASRARPLDRDAESLWQAGDLRFRGD